MAVSDYPLVIQLGFSSAVEWATSLEFQARAANASDYRSVNQLAAPWVAPSVAELVHAWVNQLALGWVPSSAAAWVHP